VCANWYLEKTFRICVDIACIQEDKNVTGNYFSISEGQIFPNYPPAEWFIIIQSFVPHLQTDLRKHVLKLSRFTNQYFHNKYLSCFCWKALTSYWEQDKGLAFLLPFSISFTESLSFSPVITLGSRSHNTDQITSSQQTLPPPQETSGPLQDRQPARKQWCVWVCVHARQVLSHLSHTTSPSNESL
jgi:hypothetical protein